MPNSRSSPPALSTPPRAAYVHVPFCAHRCGYCNFTLLAGRDELADDYLTALERELSWLAGPHEVDTLFVGGGTPTHLSSDRLDRLLDSVRRTFPLADGHELSVEANPGDIDPETIDVLARNRVTRISLGAQSFDAGKLKTLERDHAADDVARAVELARPAVDVVSLDLIFAVPGETRHHWETDLRLALRLAPDHVSTYGLTFEKGTPFWGRRLHGDLRPLDEQMQRDMYATAIDRLTSAGLEHYEVSNFARPGRRCRHNEVYWDGGEYFAAGPGAARHVDGVRETNHRSTLTYLKRVLDGRSPVAERERLDPEDKARELLVLSLRRLEGVDPARFSERTGFSVHGLIGPPLGKMLDLGLLELGAHRLRLTPAGLFVSDSIWPEFLRC